MHIIEVVSIMEQFMHIMEVVMSADTESSALYAGKGNYPI